MTRGYTLMELVVVLAMLGLLFGMSAVAFTSLRQPDDKGPELRFDEARRAALQTGQPVTLTDDSGRTVRFLPDGRAIGPEVDPFTGKLAHHAR